MAGAAAGAGASADVDVGVVLVEVNVDVRLADLVAAADDPGRWARLPCSDDACLCMSLY